MTSVTKLLPTLNMNMSKTKTMTMTMSKSKTMTSILSKGKRFPTSRNSSLESTRGWSSSSSSSSMLLHTRKASLVQGQQGGGGGGGSRDKDKARDRDRDREIASLWNQHQHQLVRDQRTIMPGRNFYCNRAESWSIHPTRAFSTATTKDDDSTTTKNELSFQAETAKLLDIVTNSLYTDKDVFLRELVSNAADALEKFRHLQAVDSNVHQVDREMDIRIETDPENNKLILHDAGIGMSKADMVDNLGTIAKSGSQNFVKELAEATSEDTRASIIGQFGVGFYSAFMVGDNVQVYSRPAKSGGTDADANGNQKVDKVHCWSSSGISGYSVKELDDSEDAGGVLASDLIGTRVVIHLKDDKECKEFASEDHIRTLLQKYSNFVGFPIFLNGERVNTIDAIWLKSPSEVEQDKYEEFYRFIAHAFDSPLMHLHFRSDVPIDMKALLFVPTMHTEKRGMGRMEPGVSLYSRKVLLESNSDKILPSWLRFVRGVVDSEDLPLSISRESMQDSRLLTQMNAALTKKMIKFFDDKAKKDTELYNKFWHEFGHFLKEGVCQDFKNQAAIAKLLRFNTSQIGEEEISSLDEYISRCDPTQDKIYYLTAPSRELAERSSYFEIFKSKNIEVIFLYSAIDDFVMSNLGEFNGRKLVPAESSEADLSQSGEDDEGKPANDDNGDDDAAPDKKEGSSSSSSSSSSLNDPNVKELMEWLQNSLQDQVSSVKPTKRLVDSPAIVVNYGSASLRRMMRMLDQEEKGGSFKDTLEKQELEVNPDHPIIQKLNDLRNSDPQLATAVARQVLDNALIGAGLIDDPRSLLPRFNSLLESLLKTDTTSTVDSQSSKTDVDPGADGARGGARGDAPDAASDASEAKQHSSTTTTTSDGVRDAEWNSQTKQ